MGDVRIGISGWRYPPWRGPFYPPRWPQARELEYASRRVGSVEINGSFYSLQHPDSYRAWRDAMPDDFVFAVKGGRFITYDYTIRETGDPVKAIVIGERYAGPVHLLFTDVVMPGMRGPEHHQRRLRQLSFHWAGRGPPPPNDSYS